MTKGTAMLPEKPYLKSTEVAKLFDVNPSTISLWVKKGRLKPHKTLGGNFRFRTSDIEKLLSEQGESGDNEIRRNTERRQESRYTFNCPVIVRVGENAFAFNYNAIIEDICGHGLRLRVFDSNGFARKLASGEVKKVTVLNLPDGLFKEVVVGEIRHFEAVGERQVEVGVSLE